MARGRGEGAAGVIVGSRLRGAIRFHAAKAAQTEGAIRDRAWLERRLMRWFERMPDGAQPSDCPSHDEVGRLAAAFARGVLA